MNHPNRGALQKILILFAKLVTYLYAVS